MKNSLRKIRDGLIIVAATIGLGQFAWSQGQFMITSIVGTEIMTLQNAGPYPVGITTANFLAGGTTPIASTYTATTANPGTVRDIWGLATTSAALTMGGSTTNNLVGVRGSFTLPAGATVNNYNDYLYGVQGKTVLPGTVDAANICGICGQWDISATTFAASGTSISVLWGDAGATSSSSANSNLAGNDSSMLRLTNTTGAKTAQITEIVADSSLFWNLAINGGGYPTYSANGGTGNSSCAKTGGAVCAKALHIQVNGVDYWLALYSSNS